MDHFADARQRPLENTDVPTQQDFLTQVPDDDRIDFELLRRSVKGKRK